MLYPMLAFGFSGVFYSEYVNDTHVFNKNQIMNLIFFTGPHFVRLVRHIGTVCDLQLKGPIIILNSCINYYLSIFSPLFYFTFL